MAQFNIDIPGVGTVTVEGNFATEDSIERLAASMRRGNVNDPFPYLRDGIDDTTDSLNLFDPAIRKNKKAVDDNTKSLNRFEGSFSRVDGLFSDMGDPGSGTLTKLVKSVGDATAGFGKGILDFLPYVGSGLSSIFTTLMGVGTGIVTSGIGFAQGLIDINKEMQMAGIASAAGLEDMKTAAQDANVPFQQFTKAMIENTDSLRLMSGGAPGGVKAVSKAMSVLTRENKEQYQSLLAMGYTIEDVMGTMTDIGLQANLVGVSLNPKELAESTNKFLRSQQELNRLAGIDIKQAREKAREQNKSFFIQKQLNDIQDPKKRSQAMSFLGIMEKFGIDDFIASGASMSATSGIMVNQLGDTALELRQLFLSLKNGNITVEEFNTGFNKIMADPKVAEAVNGMVDTFGNAKSELYRNIPVTDLEEFRALILRVNEAAKATGDAYNFQTDDLNKTTKAVVSTEQLMTDLNSALSTLGFTLFGFMSKYLGVGADAVGGVTKQFQELSKTLDQAKTAEDALIAAKEKGDPDLIREKSRELAVINKKIDDMFGVKGDPLAGPIDRLTTLFQERISPEITSAISKGFTEATKAVIDWWTGRSEKISTGQEITEKLNIQEKEKFTQPSYQGTETQTEQELYKILNEFANKNDIEAIEKLGFKLVPEGYFERIFRQLGLGDDSGVGKYKFEKLPPPPGQALGGIFDYKPGGEIVRVAEASDEIVAPAKRGSDGKLGLEVTGAMLDNSQLLKSLVKINEGQASLIASLNSQMANMNGNFEKLVYEQRQANRLAV